MTKFKYRLLFLIIFFIAAQSVLAGPLDSIGNFVSCTGANFISSLITSQILNLRNLIPNLGILGIGPVPVNDVVLNPRYQGKEYIQDVIARCAAREILTKMNQNILNVARTAGRDGGASFIRNWRSFILGSQYRGEDIWRGIVYIAANGDPNRGIPPLLCDSIRNSGIIRSLQPREAPGLIQSGLNRRTDNLQEYLVATKCDSVVNQKFNIFMQNFSAGGGWDTFERLLQPQNNIYGAVDMALKELDKQRSIEERADINEALAGSGFTSIRGTNTRGSSCLIAGFGGGCIVYKDIKTPGGVIFEGINATTQAELAFVANADELNEVIASAIQVLLNRMLNLGNPNEGDYQVPGEIDIDPESLPPPETFPEESQTIPPSGTGETTDGPFKVRHQLLSRDTVQVTAELPGFISASNFNWIDIYVDGQLVIISEPRGPTPHSCFNSPCNYINGAPLSPGSHSYYAEAQNADISYSTKNKSGSFEIGPGSTSSPTPSPTGGRPNRLDIVQKVAAEQPTYLANSCQDSGGNWNFMDEVIRQLRAVDSRFGYNGKRGNINDPSKDAISYYYGSGQPINGSRNVYIFDIISGHCGSNPNPAWQDVTDITISSGTTGAFLFPR